MCLIFQFTTGGIVSRIFMLRHRGRPLVDIQVRLKGDYVADVRVCTDLQCYTEGLWALRQGEQVSPREHTWARMIECFDNLRLFWYESHLPQGGCQRLDTLKRIIQEQFESLWVEFPAHHLSLHED